MNDKLEISIDLKKMVEFAIDITGTDDINKIYEECIREADPKIIEEFNENKNLRMLQIKEIIKDYHDTKYDNIDFDQFKGSDDKLKAPLLADFLMKKYHFVTDDITKEILLYKNGIYIDEGDVLIDKEVQRIMQDEVKSYWVKEVKDCIKRSTYKNNSEFNPVRYICLENGIYDLTDDNFQEHTHELIFTNKLPVKYDKEAVAEKWIKFVHEVLDNENSEKTLQEFFGHVIYKKYSIKHGIFSVGETDAGKTIVSKTLVKFIGEENISGIKAQVMGKRFQGAELKDKLLNMVDDSSNKPISDPTSYTQFTGGGLITAEKKLVQKQIKFYPYASFWNTFNKIPPVPEETDDAYFNRVVLLIFPFRFVWKPKKSNERQRIRPEIIEEELSTEQELSGIFNWSIEGLKRLLDQGMFSNDIDKELDIKRKEYMNKTSPVESWCNKILLKDIEAELTKDDMFLSFNKFIKNNNFPPVPRNKFFEKLETILHDNISSGIIKPKSWKGSGKERQRIWKGISVNNLEKKENENKESLKDFTI